MEHVPCRALKIEVDQSHRTCIKILFSSFVVEFLGNGSKINLKLFSFDFRCKELFHFSSAMNG